MLSSKLLKMIIEEVGEYEFLEEISRDELIDYVSSNYNPDDIFSRRELENWATGNGFVKE